MKLQLIILISLFSCNFCMTNKDAIEQMTEPEFIALESRDTIVDDLILADGGEIFGWATYRIKDIGEGNLCDYIITTNYPPEEKQ